MFLEIREVALIAVSASFMNDKGIFFRICNSDFTAENIFLHNFDLWGVGKEERIHVAQGFGF
jgi:hypothetical protein